MSNMLEQAIIDAGALKEAAVKNAETLVLEKYSNQIKEAVESLLEQVDPLAGMPDPLQAAPADAINISDVATEETVELSSVMEHIPLAVTSKDNDEILIPLDKLTEELAAFNESFKFGGDSHNISELLEQEMLSELDEESALDEDENSMITEEDLEEDLEEELDLENLEKESIEEIVEQLTVDLPGATKTGWAGMPETLVHLAEEELLAIEQDSKVNEKNTEIRQAVKKLENVNENLKIKNKKLQIIANEAKEYLLKLKDVTVILQQKLEESSLTNARLLYQNKALTSDSLNERQKEKLVEAVSNAETIEEAKVIFETLQSTVGSTSRKSQPKSLSEVVERPSSMILSARKERSKRQKNSPTLDRWKFLAGIDKDK